MKRIFWNLESVPDANFQILLKAIQECPKTEKKPTKTAATIAPLHGTGTVSCRSRRRETAEGEAERVG